MPLTPEEIYRGILELSYKNSGDQIAHMEMAHDYLVRQQRWLSETQFKELQELCWSLPGPTTMQVMVTICILKLKSLTAGLQCFLVYNCIPWLALTLLGLLCQYFFDGKTELLSYELKRVFMGFNAAAAGIMVRCFVSYFRQSWYSWPKVLLTLISTVIFCLTQSIGGVVLAICIGSVLSLYIQVGEARGKMSLKSGDLFKNMSFNFIMGKPSLMVLVLLFFGLWIYFSVLGEHPLSYIFGFYFVGCLILGPIDSIFPFFLVVLQSYGQLDPNQLWVGLPIAFLLPGTHLNIGIYFGAMMDGVRGAFLSAIFLYLPCFLSLFGLLPQWKHYRDRQGVQRLYEGVVCSLTGLCLAMVLLPDSDPAGAGTLVPAGPALHPLGVHPLRLHELRDEPLFLPADPAGRPLRLPALHLGGVLPLRAVLSCPLQLLTDAV